MSKLIVCTGTLAAGGAERVLSILSQPFADAFDEVQYVMWLDAKYPNIFYEIDPRVKIVRISKECGSTSTWRQMLWFRRYVKREKPDVVLSFMIVLCFTVTISLLFSEIKQVVALRNDPNCMKRKILRWLATCSFYAPDVKGILIQTLSIRDFFKDKKSLYKKTKVIYNPIILDEDLVGAAISHSKKNMVVSVGRLCPQKQPLILLEAFAEFCKMHPTYNLTFFGEGELDNKIYSCAKHLGIDDKVILAGRSKNAIKEILSAQIFIMTSMCEGMSNALLEAMSIGLPCISTKVSGAKDIIVDGDNGYLVDIGDVNKVAEKLSLLADDEEKRVKMGKRASLLYHELSSSKISVIWVDYLKTIAAI